MRNSILEIKGAYISRQRVAITDAAAVALTVPTSALSALISIEADATSADASKAVRFSEGSAPTAASGHILGDGSFIDVFGANMRSMKFIGIEAGKTHNIEVSYYS